ncbi:hypothetical protein HYH02_013211 [Chlamydomonas schloesseri]|uniref:Uncharacterized protein n=1 Tax=Chlamydomonas schloesseri TaxID=2026947 RepID=A0A835SR23_9CHLO|nr:hypothetical protein HYH02_013211 [Chlamydomonas schloesseri]|eukprot:KAG2431634.1 hypothetical protein HYH02_013211 [Chlamydomonas schloesseri]
MARPGMYSTGLFECCSPPGEVALCCVVWWCPCVQYGLNAKHMEPMRDWRTYISRDPDGVPCGGNTWGSCFLYGLLGLTAITLVGSTGGGGLPPCYCALPFHVPLHLQLRAYMRKKYGMQGEATHTCLVDGLSVWCCAPCAICQDAREIMIREAAQRADYFRATSGAAGGSGGSMGAYTPSAPPPPMPYAHPQPQVAYAVVNPHPHVPMAAGEAAGGLDAGIPVTGVPVAPPPPGKRN